MGITQSDVSDYYDNVAPDFGNYRYISLSDIIASFTATYVGEGKLCENVLRNDISFHAIRGLQELSYDTFRSTKDWEVEIPPSLVLVMPVDYVNYVKLSWSDSNGVERVLYPASKTSNPFNVNEPTEAHGGFSAQDTGLTETKDGDGNYSSDTWDKFKGQGTTPGEELYTDATGSRFGLDPRFAQSNGSFYIDERHGKFHFGSAMAGQTITLRYISDGLVSSPGKAIDLTKSMIPKLAEEAIYKHILYGVLSARRDTHPQVLAGIKKERFAETRKAKLRLSNIKLEELTQILRGQSKVIKH